MNTELLARYHKLEKEIAAWLGCLDGHKETDYGFTLELMKDAMKTAEKLGFNRDVDYWQGRIDDLKGG